MNFFICLLVFGDAQIYTGLVMFLVSSVLSFNCICSIVLLFWLEGWIIYIPHFKLQTFLTLNSQQACLTNIAFSQIHHGCIFFFLSIISSSMSMATLSSIVHWGIWGLQVSLKYDMLCYCIAAKMFSGFIGSVVFLSTLSTINNWLVFGERCCFWFLRV